MDDLQPQQSPIVRFWNETLAPKCLRFRQVIVDGRSKHSALVFPKLEVRPGARILDAACGFGDTTCLLAQMTGPEGHVHGIDCCDAFLAFGREEARALGLNNVSFEAADIQRMTSEAAYDMVFARFGTMFFDNPVLGLRRLVAALKPGGAFAILVWRDRNDNPAFDLAKHVVLRHLPPPGEDADTCGPGPFSQSSPEVLEGQLRAAGLSDIALERVDADITMGRDADDAVALQLALGPAGEVYREAGDEARAKHDAIVADLKEMYVPYTTDAGVIMGSSSWLATARRPA